MFNETNLPVILSDNIKVIGVVLPGGPNIYKYKSFDPSLKEDDYVVVHARESYTVARVVSTDVEHPIDAAINLKWIVQKIDFTTFDKMREDEKKAIQIVRKAKQDKQRRELREEVIKSVESPSDFNNLFKL